LNKKYRVQLTPEQRHRLEGLIRTGTAPARVQTHARILLKADCVEGSPALNDDTIAGACEVSRPTVERVRRAFVTKGLDDALQPKPPQGPPRRKLDGAQEAQLVALTCSPAPEGAERWTLALLADKLVELKVVDSIARETVRNTLTKMNLSPG
jgi:transposase